jgi:membrane-associated phospholipid phosphatase
MPRLDAAPTRATADRLMPFEPPHLRTLLALIACLATAAVAALADAAGEHDGLSRVDPLIAADVLRLRTPALTESARVFTFLGSEIVVGGLAICVLVVLLTRRQLTRAATFAIGIGGSALLTVAVKLLVARPRPSGADRLGALDTTYSFPSGHTLNSAVLLALVGWLLWPYATHLGRVTLATAGAGVAVGVAASRVYLGYHWLTDVLASGLVAVAWLCIVWLLSPMITKTLPTWIARPFTGRDDALRWPTKHGRPAGDES